MIEYYAKGSDLLCILCLNPALEPLPEPFRLQESVLLRVTFHDYVDFIHSLQFEAGSLMLAGDLNVTRRFAQLRSPLLYNCFLRDMAFALGKELSYAEHYSKHGTAIVPTSDTQLTISKAAYAGAAQRCASLHRQMQDVLKSYGYSLPASVSSCNSDLYDLALYLLYLSKQAGVQECNFQLSN